MARRAFGVLSWLFSQGWRVDEPAEGEHDLTLRTVEEQVRRETHREAWQCLALAVGILVSIIVLMEVGYRWMDAWAVGVIYAAPAP